MKDFTKRLTASVLVLSVCASFAGCNLASLLGSGSKKDKDKDDDDEGGSWFKTETSVPAESEPDVTDPVQTDPVVYVPGDYIETSDELTYADTVATYDELHPAKTPGTVTGQDAVDLLNEIEADAIKHSVRCYADAVIVFENPENYGLEFDEVTWGDAITDIADYPTEKAYYDEQLEKLYSIDYESLDTDDRLFYDKIVYDYENYSYAYSYTSFEYYTMCFNPLVGPQSDLFFVLDVFSFETVEDAENYIKLLEDIDRYYEQMISFEEERASYGFISSPTSYEAAAESFDNLVKQTDDCFLYDTFEERLDNIDGLSDADRERLIQENEDAMKNIVFPKMQDCADRLRALEELNGQDAGLCMYRGGDAYYSWLCMVQSNSSMSVEESMALCQEEVDAMTADLLAIVGSGSYDWYSEYVDHDYSKGDVFDNLDYLYDCVADDYPAIPAHEYYLMEVPEVFEDDFSPAAYLGYHLDNYDSNMLIINNGSTSSDVGITFAHEGYPGHMFQSLYTRSATSHPYMYLADSVGYAEGWAVYSETYAMLNYFAEDPDSDGVKFIYIEDVSNVMVTAALDYGIHVEGWTIDDCVDYFNTAMGDLYGVTADSLSDYYTLLVTTPCYSVKYGMGFIHTKQIMERAHEFFTDTAAPEIYTAYLNCLTTNYEELEENLTAMLSGEMEPPQGN